MKGSGEPPFAAASRLSIWFADFLRNRARVSKLENSDGSNGTLADPRHYRFPSRGRERDADQGESQRAVVYIYGVPRLAWVLRRGDVGKMGGFTTGFCDGEDIPPPFPPRFPEGTPMGGWGLREKGRKVTKRKVNGDTKM